MENNSAVSFTLLARSKQKCSTCGSRGRQLKPLGELHQAYNALVNSLDPENIDLLTLQRSDALCWECLAFLKKLNVFIKQIEMVKCDHNFVGSNLGCAKQVSWNSELFDFRFHDIKIKQDPVKIDCSYEPKLNVKREVYSETSWLNEVYENASQISLTDDLNVAQKMDIKKERKVHSKRSSSRSGGVKLSEVAVEPKPKRKKPKKKRDFIRSTAYNRYKGRPISERELLLFREELKLQEPYASARHRCEKCIKPFSKQHVLANHIEKYHSFTAGEYACYICDIRVRTPVALTAHTKAHFYMFNCKQCEFRTTGRHLMDTHCGKQHPAEKMPCKLCEYVADSFMQYKYHLKKHREKKLCTCDHCGKQMTKYSLRTHVQAHLGRLQPELSCEMCDFKVRGEAKLSYHIRQNHREQPPLNPEDIYCVECNIFFKNKTSLKAHLETTMRHAKHILKFGCDYCPTKFKSEAVLKSHIAHNHIPKKCDVCDHMLKSVHSYKRHMRVKHGQGVPYRFFCSVCNKAFKYTKNLREHEWSHTGERPYTCAVCGDTFRQSAALYTHNRLKHKDT